jgi:hypothetical protein
MKINRNTTVELGLVITLIAAACTFGVMWNKVDNVEKDISEIKQDVKAVYNYVFDKRTAAQ